MYTKEILTKICLINFYNTTLESFLDAKLKQIYHVYIFSFQIFITEKYRSKEKSHDQDTLNFFKWNISACKQNLYKYIGIFLLGTASCQLLTDIGKYSVGRFRPHFITVSIFLYKFYI